MHVEDIETFSKNKKAKDINKCKNDTEISMKVSKSKSFNF